MTGLALLFIGYSLLCACGLALTHFRPSHYADAVLARVMGLVVLAALCLLQLIHFIWLYQNLPWVDSALYRLALYAVAPAFYVFSQALLVGQMVRPRLLWHGLPLLLCLLLPSHWATPGAFLLGAGYLLLLGRCLLSLRGERVYFRAEMLLLGVVLVVAIGVSVLGALQSLLPDKLFFSLYACAIGLALFCVQLTLGLRPSLAADVSQTLRASYTASSLNNVDCDAALARLNQLMQQERMFTDNNLSLASLAERLSLSSHQTSELLNSRIGKSFSRYVREARVAAAKAMLVDEPSASVLSVGLSQGFSSQSTFYDAFREIEGMTPGQWRKLAGRAARS